MKTLRESYERYERRISAVAIIIAFIIDSVTLVRIDLYLTNLLLFVYLTIVGTGIAIINLQDDGKLPWLSENAHFWVFAAVQFSFGGLFGRYLIYYSRSGSLSASWPFLLILAGLLIGNEFAKKYYSRLLLQISFFFLAIFFFLIFFIPVLVGYMSTGIFILSGLVSLLVIALFIFFLSYLIPKRIAHSRFRLFMCVSSIFFLINGLYFANIIPPLPLSLHAAGIYHFVGRSADDYEVRKEEGSPYDFLHLHQTLHLLPGQPLYAYSAVFAPTNFDTYIVHRWQYYDVDKKAWVDAGRVSFPITGGQDRGYRGYSEITNVRPGTWRVSIQTLRGQVIGRLKFYVETVQKEAVLETENL